MGKDLFDISGKVAVVNGSTRGIGLATVEQLCSAGASRLVSSENAGDVDAAVARLPGACIFWRQGQLHSSMVTTW